MHNDDGNSVYKKAYKHACILFSNTFMLDTFIIKHAVIVMIIVILIFCAEIQLQRIEKDH